MIDRLFSDIVNDPDFADYKKRKCIWRSTSYREFAKSLFSLEELDVILNSNHLNPKEFNLFRNGQPLAEDKYCVPTRGVGNLMSVDKSKLGPLVQDEGYSLKVFNIDRFSKKLQNFKASLVSLYQSQVTINCYLTPRVEPCFGEHQDHYPIFIFQIAGSKEWYTQSSTASTKVDFEEASKIIEKGERTVLCEGDIFYLPQSVLHKAKNHSHYPSLHLTIGIQSFSLKDFIQFLFEQPTMSLFLLQNLSPQLEPFDEKSINLKIKKFMEFASKETIIKKNFDKFIRTKNEMQPEEYEFNFSENLIKNEPQGHSELRL